MSTATEELKARDFKSDQEVRWCPGCQDYSILAQVQRVLPDLGLPKENIVFISGIGCAGRFPYYMDTYGFHTIHGRAPAFATGLKALHPELKVFVVTGDGDGLSIGGNHLAHVCRRNVDVTILLFNNRIYGLTKGQYSPTSEQGKVTKSTPLGSIDYPFNPLSFVIGAGATFVARSNARDAKHLQTMLKRAAAHKGTSFVEIWQNCNIFNDATFENVTGKDVRDEEIIYLEDGEPLMFGTEGKKGLVANRFNPDIATIGEDGVSEEDFIVHNEKAKSSGHAFLLAQLEHPEYPTPMGVFRAVENATYDEALRNQVAYARERKGKGDLEGLINAGDTWTVD